MRKITQFSFLIAFAFISCQQESRSYNELITAARAQYEAGAFEASGALYSLAFETGEADSLQHHYEAARSWALAGDHDRAFAHLEEITGEGEYANLAQISTDPDFGYLRSDERWLGVLQGVSENKKDVESRMAGVAATLRKVYADDQKYRQQLGQIEQQYGRDSEEMQAHWVLINKTDSVNLIKVREVLDTHGWLGYELIGRPANNALFLVIQHADLATQEQYLPMLREAVKKGDAAGQDLALLEDRVVLKQGKKQLYGSQIGRNPETGEYYVSPLEDPDNVDKRRAEVGLGPLQEYISTWGLTWDVEAHKEQQQALEVAN